MLSLTTEAAEIVWNQTNIEGERTENNEEGSKDV